MTPDDAMEGLTLALDKPAGIIRLKAVATFDAPVELSPDAARALGRELLRLADELD